MAFGVYPIIKLNWAWRLPFPTCYSATSTRLWQTKLRQFSSDVPQTVPVGREAKAASSVEKAFFQPQVQSLLQNLTGRLTEKVFGRRQVAKIRTSHIRLLTDEELDKARREKLKEVDMVLQMPPVMAERQPCEEVIVEDPRLEEYNSSRHVFVDITYGVKPRKRYMVVRETNGTLRRASWEERDKLNQIYFPISGRSIDFPLVFEDGNLKAALDRGFHHNILDRACIQFEPDDPNFIRICHTVYDSINDNRNFSLLESTRHMGGLIFRIVSIGKPENYLIYLLQKDRMDSVVDLLTLHYIIHPEGAEEFASILSSNDDGGPLAALKHFIKSSGQTQGNLQLAMQAYQEDQRQMQEEERVENRRSAG
ncbi:28S ribosomal protein S22, mitochondrial [Hypsibius exemplaris]|uniref:28S ribosomal protein S22, mitochondrial n=1 Tax=Hypsibius exemplaris TaxID=2072580 RepID=A0A1W0XBA0_HYPEX|nr:28S ribosomal protein S22, mitochondrial [Hypsibius exemplaris]